MPSRVCRWGILGTAQIARKNWKAIANAENSTLAAVASRDRAKAATFIQECQESFAFPTAPEPVGGYEELLARPDIDAVYIPLPTGIRKEWVIKAANAKKHILCEKPCAITPADLRAMIDVCRERRVQFMDGVMFMHGLRLPIIRQALDDGESVGRIRRIASQFSFLAGDDFLSGNIRVSDDLEPLGALGDLGWYNIRFSLFAMNEQLPERVSGRILSRHGRRDSKNPVNIAFSGELFYPEGTTAGFHCSFNTENHQWASISGDKGSLRVDDFVLPFFGCESSFELSKPFFRVNGCDFNMEARRREVAIPEYSNSAPDSQETRMIRTFADLALSSKPDDRWAEQALRTQQVLEACLQSAWSDGKLTSIT